MNQVLRIFRKDTRRFWVEILLSLLVLAIYVNRYHLQYQVQSVFPQPNFLFVVRNPDSLLAALIPATWWLLIARVIQAESLTGDRQWWLTRPYRWKSLLAAKALFLLFWIYIPYLLSQVLVMSRASLAPLGHPSHWFFLLAFVSSVVIVPLVAIATITRNFARMTATLLGSMVAAIAFMVVASENGPVYALTTPYLHHGYIFSVLFAGGVTAIVLQYATHRVQLTRGILVSVAALAACVGLVLIAARQGEADRLFPAPNAGSAPPLQITYQPTPSNPLYIYPAPKPGMLYTQLPFEISGVAQGAAVELETIRFTLDAGNGETWNSPWWNARSIQYLSGTYHPGVVVMLSREQYQRFRAAPITLHVTLGVTELRAASETTVAFSEGDFKVQNFGVCTSTREWFLRQTVFCRTEVGQTPLTHIATTWSNYPCSGPQPEPQGAFTGAAWTGQVYPDPFDNIWNPVALNMVNYDWRRSNGHMVNPRDLTLCPGTPIHFTQFAIVRRTQVSLTVPNFQLPTESR